MFYHGCKTQVLREGGGVATRPTPLSRVRIRTKGQLDNGAVVDKHSSIPFTLGDGDVLQGLIRNVYIPVILF